MVDVSRRLRAVGRKQVGPLGGFVRSGCRYGLAGALAAAPGVRMCTASSGAGCGRMRPVFHAVREMVLSVFFPELGVAPMA